MAATIPVRIYAFWVESLGDFAPRAGNLFKTDWEAQSAAMKEHRKYGSPVHIFELIVSRTLNKDSFFDIFSHQKFWQEKIVIGVWYKDKLWSHALFIKEKNKESEEEIRKKHEEWMRERQRQQQEQARQQHRPSTASSGILDPYAILGVKELGLTEAELKSAYRKAALANHPDRGGSVKKMADVNNANDMIRKRKGWK